MAGVSLTRETHLHFLRKTVELAKESPPKPTNFRVGCVIVAFPHPVSGSEVELSQQLDQGGHVISTGFTLELAGNTHAEQCALDKCKPAADRTQPSVPDHDNWDIIFAPNLNVVLYTSLEPCGKRLSGNLPCVQRIIATRSGDPKAGIRKVIFGAKEPGTFVQDSQSCKLLTEAGIEWDYLPDFEEEILRVAMEGHKKEGKPTQQDSSDNRSQDAQDDGKPLNHDQEEQRQATAESAPRNPKKRMMEAPPGSEASRS